MQRDFEAQREEEAFDELNVEQDTLTEDSSEVTSEEVTSNDFENSETSQLANQEENYTADLAANTQLSL